MKACGSSILFYVSCALSLAGLCLVGYILFTTPMKAPPPSSIEPQSRDPVEPQPQLTIVETEPMPETAHGTFSVDYLQPTTRCDSSVVGIMRGKTPCFESKDGLSNYVCLDDIVRDQMRLLALHSGLEYVCTTMFQLRNPNDTIPCVCSMTFPGRDGGYTIVQPSVIEVSVETDVVIMQGRGSGRLPVFLEVVNRYSAQDHATITFRGNEVPRVAEALRSIGIDVYQSV